MADKVRKNNKNMIIGGVCAAVVVVVIIIVAVVLATRGSGINDGYFVSDGSKYVLTIESDTTDESEGTYNPVKTHIVYTYSGDQITGMKTYGEFANADKAKQAFEAIKDAGEDMTNYVVEGKYIIVTATEDQYKDLTAKDVKAQIEFMESLKNMNSDELNAEAVQETEATEAEQ